MCRIRKLRRLTRCPWQQFRPARLMGIALQAMTKALRDASEENARNDWFKTGQSELADQVRGDKNIHTLSRDIIVYLAKYLDAQVGTFYIAGNDGVLNLSGTYAFTKRKKLVTQIHPGHGLVGEAALEKEHILISDVPEDYIRVESSLGSAVPRNILVIPVLLQNRVKGIMELGSIMPFTDTQIEFLTLVAESIAIVINSAQERQKAQELLEQTQRQAGELQVQQEELRMTNEELQTQQEELKVSNEHLQAQQEELRLANEGLAEKTRALELQKIDIEKNNQTLQLAKEYLVKKAKALEVASKYKSEFLANMSHELRTPLNSLLLLSKKLTRNKEGNLTEKQVNSARIIYNSGNNLLALLNDILDLSKIEAGKMDIHITTVEYTDIMANIAHLFGHVIEEKGLEFHITIDPILPATLRTDQQKLEQILKNLISNATKFTEKGEITIAMRKPGNDVDLSGSGLSPDKAVAFAVTDTGIGVPKEKHVEIFEAFQQVDGSTSRKYAGTGLGLSISRELTKLLGGEIHVQSEEGIGSTFTVFIAEELKETGHRQLDTGHRIPEIKSAHVKQDSSSGSLVQDETRKVSPSIKDDRNNITKDDKVVLIIEDDLNFARVLYEVCHEKDFQCIHAGDGETGLDFAERYTPHAIILDMKLPGIQGGQVLETLKGHTSTRHIPVQIMSAYEKTMDTFQKGAIGYLTKPVNAEQLDRVFADIRNVIAKEVKDLLIVEDDDDHRKSIEQLLESENIQITAAGKGKEALELMKTTKYDCMILDLRLPDISGFDVLGEIAKLQDRSTPPVIIYTGKELSPEEHFELDKYADSVVLKGVKSDERLIDETTLFLHTIVEDMSAESNKRIDALHAVDGFMKGKKVMVVDDDMRNLFALTDELEDHNRNDFALILIDVQMPAMDGFETVELIRKEKKNENIPVIFLSAVYSENYYRIQGVQAGCVDFISKPIIEELLIGKVNTYLTLYRQKLKLQKTVEELRKSEEQIKASLREKEVLLKEIHHQVKNNLQVVSSLLYLQSKRIQDDTVRALFTESQERVKSMALVHKALYQSENFTQIDFAPYLRKLFVHIFQAFRGSSGRITSKIDVRAVALNIDAAVPCGLIFNELVSNALKYAFPDKDGEIRIHFDVDNNNNYVLVVSDNGIGFPADFDFQNAKSLGLKLVHTLVDQLDGTIELHRNGGTTFQIVFTEPNYRSSDN